MIKIEVEKYLQELEMLVNMDSGLGNPEGITAVGKYFADRLAEAGTKILLLGVGLDKNTFIHSVEEVAQVPDRLEQEPWDVTIFDWEGRELHRPFVLHRCSRSNDVSRQYVNFEKPLRELGAMKFGRLGDAQVRIVDAGLCKQVILKICSRATEDLCVEFMDLPEELYR